MNLTELLKSNPNFQTFSAEQKDVFARLANEFEDNPLALYLSPEELTHKLQLGNPQLWQQFLQMEPVQQYIKGQIAFNAQVASRKALQALTKEAQLGDVQAARQINDISGILNQANNRVVVLHRVDRPKVAKQEEPN